jgi:hypothetical protein
MSEINMCNNGPLIEVISEDRESSLKRVSENKTWTSFTSCIASDAHSDDPLN